MTRNKDELLVLNNETVNDRGWKYEFFFANKKSLGPAADKLLERWNVEGKFFSHLAVLFVFTPYCVALILLSMHVCFFIVNSFMSSCLLLFVRSFFFV